MIHSQQSQQRRMQIVNVHLFSCAKYPYSSVAPYGKSAFTPPPANHMVKPSGL